MFVINFNILWSHFSKGILTTEEVITAIFKVISATTKVILATEEVIITNLNVISATTKVILATGEVSTVTLKVISAPTKVILVTDEMITATEKSSRQCNSYLGGWRSDHSHFRSYLSHYKGDLGH